MRLAHRKWKAKNDRRSYYKLYDASRSGQRITYRMWHSAKHRAAKIGLPFTIEEVDILIPDHCPICNVLMSVASGVKGGHADSPTLDKVRNVGGYTKDNIAVICKGCNSKKGHATPEELRRIADWMELF